MACRRSFPSKLSETVHGIHIFSDIQAHRVRKVEVKHITNHDSLNLAVLKSSPILKE